MTSARPMCTADMRGDHARRGVPDDTSAMRPMQPKNHPPAGATPFVALAALLLASPTPRPIGAQTTHPTATQAPSATRTSGATARAWAVSAFDTVAGGPGRGVRVSLQGGVLRVRDTAMNAAAAPLVLPLAAVSAADSAVRARVLDVRHRPARLYVLLLVAGARRGGPPAGGGAGGGTASAGAYPPCAPTASLVWLAVDPYATVVASRSVAVQDCREVVRIDGVVDETGPPAFASDVLTTRFFVGPPPLEPRRVMYDRRAPQRGLTGDFDRP